MADTAVRKSATQDRLSPASHPADVAGQNGAVRQDTGPSNTIVRNPAPDAAPPALMPQIYGSYTISR